MKYVAATLLGLLAGCVHLPDGKSDPATDNWWFSAYHGTSARDPVSGKFVDTRWAVARSYWNQNFFFEDESTAKTFDSNPEFYGSYHNPYYYVLQGTRNNK